MNQNLINKSLVFALLGLILASCTRDESASTDNSTIEIQTPKRGSANMRAVALGQPLPTDKRVCYAVNVSGSGVSGDLSNACISGIQQVAGFVTEGESLTLSVPKGSARKFQVYLYLTDINSSCPAWNETFKANLSSYDKLYKVAEVEGVELVRDEEVIEMTVSFPGLANSVGLLSEKADCRTNEVSISAPELRAVTLSSGVVVAKTSSSSRTLLSFAKAYWASFIQIVAGSFLESDIEGVSSNVTMVTSGIQVMPYFKSVTKKPDTGLVYGLDESGQIYLVGSNGLGSEVSESQCPFAKCRVPVWIQSISAGNGTDLFALDHAGNIYQVGSGSLVPIGDPVNLAVNQVLFY